MQTCVFCFLRKCQHIFGTHPTVKVHQVNYRLTVSASVPEKMRGSQTCYLHSRPHIWSAYSSKIPDRSRLICFASVAHTAVTARYLPVDRGGQQPYHTVATVDLRVQRSTELLKMADASEPSSLADAPVLCRAVRGDDGREKRSEWTMWNH